MKEIWANHQKFIYLLIILHLAITLPLAYILNIWIDEASTLYTTQNIAHAFQNALADEKQAPLYFWILSFWRSLNDSIFFARIFSIICSIAAIKFFGDLVKNYFFGKVWLFVTAFFALHPYLIWASVEIRVYSLVILLSVLLLKFFHEGYLETDLKNSAKARIFYTILAIIALYTNYYLGFLLVGNFFALLSQRKFKSAQKYFLQMLLVGIVFLPLVWAIKSQFSANSEGIFTEKSAAEGIRMLWNIFLTFTLPTEIFPVEQITKISFFRLWLMRLGLIIGAVLIFKNRSRLNRINAVYAVISAVVFAFLLVAYFLLGPVYVGVRHAAVLFPPLIIFFWSILEVVVFPETEKSSKFKTFLPVFLIIFYGIFFVYSVFTIHPNFTKRGDWARIGAFIEQNETPDQPIIIYRTFDALALPQHYKGANRIYPDERFFEWNVEDNPASPKAFLKQTEFIISEIPPEVAEIWLVTDSSCSENESCQPLENFVEANYTVLKQKDFYAENVRLLRKKLK